MSNGDEPASAPEPISDAVSEPFWAAASEGILVVQRCEQCSTFHHPPVAICPSCLSVRLAFEPVSGRGRVAALTRTHVARDPYFAQRTPYIVALIELEESGDLLMLSNLPFDSGDEITIGASVTVEFEDRGVSPPTPQFRLSP